jgi:hypothetical protein
MRSRSLRQLTVLLIGVSLLALVAVATTDASTSYVARFGSGHGAARLSVGGPNSVYVNASSLASGSWTETLYRGSCTRRSTKIATLPVLIVGRSGAVARTNTLTSSQANLARTGVIRLARGTALLCGGFASPIVARPSPTPSPTPAPTDPSAGTVLLDVSGTGTSTTAVIAVPANWEIDYVYDCTASAIAGSFSITVNRGTGVSDTPVSTAGTSGGDAVLQRDRRGSVSLQITSSCSWEVIVIAD